MKDIKKIIKNLNEKSNIKKSKIELELDKKYIDKVKQICKKNKININDFFEEILKEYEVLEVETEEKAKEVKKENLSNNYGFNSEGL